MANASRKVSVSFEGKTDGLRKASKDANDQLTKVARAGGRTFRVLAILATLSAIAPIMVGIAVALAQLAAAALAVPAALLALIGIFGAFKLATSGFGAAVTAADPTAFVIATHRMAPAMVQAVRAVRALNPQLYALRRNVQAQFWTGFVAEVNDLSSTFLPILDLRLSSISGALGRVRAAIGRSLLTPRAVAAFNTVLIATAALVDGLGPALGKFVSGLVQLAEIGSTLLPGFGTWVDKIATDFERWVEAGAESGHIADLIRASGAAFRDLGGIFNDLFDTLSALFTGLAGGTDSSPLRTLHNLTTAMREFFQAGSSSDTFNALGGFLREIGGEVVKIFRAGLQFLGPFLVALGPIVVELARAFSKVLVPAFGELGPAITRLVIALTPALIGGMRLIATVLVDFVIPALTWFIDLLTRAVNGVTALVLGMRSIGGGLFGGGSTTSSGGGISGFFSRIAAGIGSLFGRASGGEVLAGQAYRVGERGPETFTPGRSGSISPAGGGNTWVSIKIGERELLDIISTVVRRDDENTVLSVLAGSTAR